jgi:hypothetical protein
MCVVSQRLARTGKNLYSVGPRANSRNAAAEALLRGSLVVFSDCSVTCLKAAKLHDIDYENSNGRPPTS